MSVNTPQQLDQKDDSSQPGCEDLNFDLKSDRRNSFKTMEGECKVQLDAAVDAEARKGTTQSVRAGPKLTTILLTFTLCLAAAATVAVSAFNRHAKVGTQFLFKSLDY